MRIMFDSTTPAAIPDNAPMVAGYMNGRFKWAPADWARFAHVPAVHINVSGDPAGGGDCLDVETGDATPDHAPAWWDARRAAGQRQLTIYCDRSNLIAVNRAMGTRPFFHWLATLDGTLHAPQWKPFHGPAAIQFADSAHAGINVDVSLVLNDQWHPAPSAAIPAAAMGALHTASTALADALSILANRP